jgi:hypothetical protein
MHAMHSVELKEIVPFLSQVFNFSLVVSFLIWKAGPLLKGHAIRRSTGLQEAMEIASEHYEAANRQWKKAQKISGKLESDKTLLQTQLEDAFEEEKRKLEIEMYRKIKNTEEHALLACRQLLNDLKNSLSLKLLDQVFETSYHELQKKMKKVKNTHALDEVVAQSQSLIASGFFESTKE